MVVFYCLKNMDRRLFWVFGLSSIVYFTQGIEGLPSQGLFYYLKETLNFSPQKIMIIGTITSAAWVIKPVIGYFIDNFLSKKIWIFISLILDIGLVFTLGTANMSVGVLIAVLLITSSNAAIRDVSVDGIMCVEGKKYSMTGKIQSVQWISINIAALVVGIGGGFIAQKWGYKPAFLFLIPVYIAIGVIAHLYREETGEKTQISAAHFAENMKKLFTDKRLMIVALFIFLYKYSPSFGTPLFFIQRDTFKWDKIWIGWLGTISTLCGIIGSVVYYKYSTRIKIKKWLFWSVFVGAVTTLSYLYYTPVTAVLYDILYGFAGMFIFLMIMDFMARNSTAGFEATSFAFLCSISNIALFSSNLSGAFLLPVIGLNWLIIISSLTSFLCLPLINKIKE